MSPESLPCEGEVPERFAQKLPLRLMYCDGFQDGVNDRPMQSNDAVRRHQGYHAWEAYSLGYEAGKARRLAEQAAT